MTSADQDSTASETIEALLPRGAGHHFAFYGDACSGIAGGRHEATFASINRVVARLSPQPEFIIFPGDEIVGLTTDEDELRAQWRYWLDVEMAWLDRERVPLYHTTANHTTYDRMSERVFAEALSYLPRNGPADQQGLSYFVRRGDLLLIFVNTCWSGLGGEGHLETIWLEETLRAQSDARFKFVVGHHPIFPVNGFSGPCQREVAPEHATTFWRLLVDHGVFAYLCSHILAFDVQVHEGVLQVLSAGAGTAHRMPEESEYLHCVQMAIDAEGLRYRVLDRDGVCRERLSWPLHLTPSENWMAFVGGAPRAPDGPVTAWRLSGRSNDRGGPAQTLMAAWESDPALPVLWVGLTGASQRLTAILGNGPGRSPHSWFGPEIAPDAPFDVQFALHRDMGPGGLLWRSGDDSPWTSLAAASPWGAERFGWPSRWSIGHGKGGAEDSPFLGRDLSVRSNASSTNHAAAMGASRE